MRILIVEKGKILTGQKERFHLLCVKEGKILKKIDAKFRKSDPENYKDIPQPFDWTKEGKKSLMSACWRFGDGSISVDE